MRVQDPLKRDDDTDKLEVLIQEVGRDHHVAAFGNTRPHVGREADEPGTVESASYLRLDRVFHFKNHASHSFGRGNVVSDIDDSHGNNCN